MFYDANGKLNVYMTRESRLSPQASQQIIEQVRASVQARQVFAPLASDINIIEGAHDFTALAELRGRMGGVFGVSGVVYTDIDEANNRVRVGVLGGTSAAEVQAALAQAGIPAGAVSVEVTEAIMPLATLRDARDPLGGGLQIWRFTPPSTANICTLGFNVRTVPNDGERYFFTNSHCTADRGTVDGTAFRQGPLSLATRTVADEVADPPFFTCQYTGYRCRYSDAALAKYRPEYEEVKLGLIYQTTGANNGSLETVEKNFTITDEKQFPVLGDAVNKVGRTTGWTSGQVIGTCIDTGVAGGGPPTVMLCQDWVSATSAGGDSGSPIFQLNGVKQEVTLFGILWGGGGGTSVFSALQNIRAEFPAFRTN